MYWKPSVKRAVPDSSACTNILCMLLFQVVEARGEGVGICVCAHVCASMCERMLQYMSISFLSQSCYSTFIPLVGLYPVLLCL